MFPIVKMLWYWKKVMSHYNCLQAWNHLFSAHCCIGRGGFKMNNYDLKEGWVAAMKPRNTLRLTERGSPSPLYPPPPPPPPPPLSPLSLYIYILCVHISIETWAEAIVWNALSHWPSPYTEWSLHRPPNNGCTGGRDLKMHFWRFYAAVMFAYWNSPRNCAKLNCNDYNCLFCILLDFILAIYDCVRRVFVSI